MVDVMTTEAAPQSTEEARACGTCSHDLDPHALLLVIEDDPAPMGLVVCPVPGCTCAATWRAGAGRSTPEQIAETRTLVRAKLIADGYPIPDGFLQ
jgi:hypothetical protein